MTQFSANLGFLWNELSLPEAIQAAKHAGFHAVECHWPYDTPAHLVKSALHKSDLKMLGLNTSRGDPHRGEFGLSALPDSETDARLAIDQALNYAIAIEASSIHVMAGNATGEKARGAFLNNLRYACSKAKPHAITILIEPINEDDAPNYYLKTQTQAMNIINRVAEPNLKLMFDCYHVGKTEGDIVFWLEKAWPYIGHIQFASVPDRGPPDHGEIDYSVLFKIISDMGWEKPLGAEFKPIGLTNDALAWLDGYK